MRPPTEDEKPKIKWLAYGSSITHGAGAQLHTNSYIMSAARDLGVDVLCKGMGGSCYLENDMADFIANEEWDFITLELGVNVREIYTEDVFRSKAEYLVETIKKKNPDKPVIFITIFPNSATYCNSETVFKTREFEFNNIIREIYNEYASDGFTYLIEGSDILKRFDWLTCDLIHPSEYGHFMMGLQLSNIIKDIIK
jgi:lysophospholipase L1-like esterase